MTYSIEIINKDSLKFRFQEGECKNLSLRKSVRSIKQDIPNGESSDTVIISLGVQETSSFPFLLRSTDTDASDGTYPSAQIKTVQDKVDYLRDVFLTTNIDDFYTLNIYTSAANVLGLKASLDDFALDFTSEKPNTLPGS